MLQQFDAYRDIPNDAGMIGLRHEFDSRPTWAIDDELDLLRDHWRVVRQLAPYRECLLVLALLRRGMAPLS